MIEDPTKDLTTDEILRLILNRITGVETRFSALESLVEDRLKDTRPIWQAINTRTERIEESLAEAHKGLRSIDRKFDVLNKEIFAMKTDIRDFDERLTELEQRPN
jgi:hypothetical protein